MLWERLYEIYLKKQAMDWEKIFADQYLTNDWYLDCIKELSTEKSIIRNGQICTWKDVQHYSLAIRKIQIKITMRYHNIPIRIDKIKMLRMPNVGEDAEKLDLLYTAGGNVK